MIFSFLLARPVTLLRRHDIIAKEDLVGNSTKNSISLGGLCKGCHKNLLFAVDTDTGQVMRIDIRRKMVINIYAEVDSYMCDIGCLCGTAAAAPQILALLVANNFYERIYNYSVLVLEEAGNTSRFTIAEHIIINETADLLGGRTELLRNGRIVVKGYNMRHVHVWRRGKQSPLAIKIPGEHYKTLGMCVMEKVLKMKELIAFVFADEKSIGIFQLAPDGLMFVQNIDGLTTPFELLWIPMNHAILISNEWINEGNINAIRLSGSNVTLYNVTIEGVKYLHVWSWTFYEHNAATDDAIAIFDEVTQNVIMFDLF